LSAGRQARLPSKEDQDDSRDRKEKEEEIVLFKKAFVLMGVVIAMKIPQGSMHDILMAKPCHELHSEEGCQEDNDL
jgi:hypothetical protein